MRYVILIFFFLLPFFSTSQITTKLQGTWKIIGMGNNELNIDQANKKITTSPTINRDSALTDSFSNYLLENFPASEFIFENNGQFIEKENGEIRFLGTYKIDKKTNHLFLNGITAGHKIQREMQVKFKNSFLFLTEILDEERFTLKLIKLK